MYWSSKELLESNNLLAGWSGFELRSTPLQSKKITAIYEVYEGGADTVLKPSRLQSYVSA